MSSRYLSAVMMLVTVTVISGCQKRAQLDLAEATGVIKYEGEPLNEASVMFMPDSGTPAHGTTDANGAFTLSTRGQPGATIGSGKVTVIAAKENYPGVPEDKLTAEQIRNQYTELIPAKYGNPHTSGLTATIEAGKKNDLSFDLKK